MCRSTRRVYFSVYSSPGWDKHVPIASPSLPYSPPTITMAASIANFFTTTRTTARQDSDDFVAPESMRSTVHDNPNIVIQPDEFKDFKLYGKQYVRCNAIAKPPKHIKKRTLIIWKFGEDIPIEGARKEVLVLLQMLSSSRMKTSTLLHIGMNVTTHNPIWPAWRLIFLLFPQCLMKLSLSSAAPSSSLQIAAPALRWI